MDFTPLPATTFLAELPLDEGETVASMAHCLLNAPEQHGYLLIATSANRLFLLRIKDSGEISSFGPLIVHNRD